jgi:hypothetical protein
MAAASIEATQELWASSLRAMKRLMRPLFKRDRLTRSAEHFVDRLPGEERLKTGWMRAEATSDPSSWRQQAILGRGQWGAGALRDFVRDYALETHADADAVLVVDEASFLKQRNTSCGVAHQNTGSTGTITNCQIGVFACHVAERGHAFIDREFYVPKSGTDDKARIAKAHAPQKMIDGAHGGVATKPTLTRTRDYGECAVLLRRRRYCPRRRRHRDGAPARQQSLCARRKLQRDVWLMEQAATRRRHSKGDCRRPASVCLRAPGQRASARMTAPISSAPISTPEVTARRLMAR